MFLRQFYMSPDSRKISFFSRLDTIKKAGKIHKWRETRKLQNNKMQNYAFLVRCFMLEKMLKQTKNNQTKATKLTSFPKKMRIQGNPLNARRCHFQDKHHSNSSMENDRLTRQKVCKNRQTTLKFFIIQRFSSGLRLFMKAKT